jgi:putative flippase GtrA
VSAGGPGGAERVHGGDARPSPRGFRALLDNGVVRYLLVGGSAFVVDLGLLALFHELLGWPVWIATAVAFLLSFAYTYTLQRLAFRSERTHGTALVRYTILVAVNLVATSGLVALLAVTPIGWVGAKVVTTAVTTVWNFFIYRYWVFAAPRSDAASTSAPTQEV